MRCDRNRTYLYLFAWLLIGAAYSPAQAIDARPNFMLILADDLCWRDLGFTGNPDVQTPNLDALARDGIRLQGMFVTSATCSPVRHALYTGLYPVRSGAYPNHTMVEPETRSLFSYLKSAGYRVALIGKQHVHPPSAFPFELLSRDPDDVEKLEAFIAQDADQPWLAVVASNDPHAPWTRGPRGLYNPAKLRLPAYLHDNAFTREQLAAYYAEITQLDKQVGACLAAIERTGDRENTLVLFLSEQGSSFPYGGKWSLYDNGVRSAAVARWPARVKAGASSDALVQDVDVTPTFLEAAGISLAEVDTGCPDANGTRGLDGRSFLDVLLGRTEQHRDYVFSQHTTVGVNGYEEPYPTRGVRDRRYKLLLNLMPHNTYWIRGLHGGEILASWERDAATNEALAQRIQFLSHRPEEELYDLLQDGDETTNLATDPQFAEIKRQLRAELEQWMRQQGDQGIKTELQAIQRQPRAHQ